jgi:hypothetical protein
MTEKGIISIKEFVGDTIDGIGEKVHKHTIPLYFLKKGNNTPLLHGSSVIIDIKGTKFLITASHVFDNNIEPFLLLDDFIQPLNGKRLDLESTREMDSSSIDISILKLHESVIKKIESSSRYEFYKLDKTTYYQTSNRGFLLSGYPCRKEKINVKDKQVISSLINLIVEQSSDKLYEKLGYSNELNVILKYNRRKITNFKSNKRFHGPLLNGMSGCGLWNFTNPLLTPNETPKYFLKGIFIEYHSKYSILVCQNIKFVIDRIEQKFNLKL